MRRSSRRTVKRLSPPNESSDEEPELRKKKKKDTDEPPQKSQTDPADDSSSESDIENYLKPTHEIDLNSSFFQVQEKESPTFDAIEKDIFSGVNRLSDSDSESENDVETNEQPKEDEKVEKAAVPNSQFRQLHEYSKKLQEAKKLVEEYKAKKGTDPSKKLTDENKLDILNILTMTEGKNAEQSQGEMYTSLNSSDFESFSESEKEDWEVVEGQDEEPLISKDGVEITLRAPELARKKKGIDLMAVMKRRINRVRKENQVYVHKVHLLCWLGHGNYVNDTLNSQVLLALALSLLPSQHCYPSKRVDLNYLEQILTWYKKAIKVVNKSESSSNNLETLLQEQITKKEVYNNKMLVYVFICILRSLSVRCRLVLSLQVEPLRPPSSELCSLSQKTSDKGSTSTKNDSKSAKSKPKGNEESNSLQKNKQKKVVTAANTPKLKDSKKHREKSSRNVDASNTKSTKERQTLTVEQSNKHTDKSKAVTRLNQSEKTPAKMTGEHSKAQKKPSAALSKAKAANKLDIEHKSKASRTSELVWNQVDKLSEPTVRKSTRMRSKSPNDCDAQGTRKNASTHRTEEKKATESDKAKLHPEPDVRKSTRLRSKSPKELEDKDGKKESKTHVRKANRTRSKSPTDLSDKQSDNLKINARAKKSVGERSKSPKDLEEKQNIDRESEASKGQIRKSTGNRSTSPDNLQMKKIEVEGPTTEKNARKSVEKKQKPNLSVLKSQKFSKNPSGLDHKDHKTTGAVCSEKETGTSDAKISTTTELQPTSALRRSTRKRSTSPGILQNEVNVSGTEVSAGRVIQASLDDNVICENKTHSKVNITNSTTNTAEKKLENDQSRLHANVELRRSTRRRSNSPRELNKKEFDTDLPNQGDNKANLTRKTNPNTFKVKMPFMSRGIGDNTTEDSCSKENKVDEDTKVNLVLSRGTDKSVEIKLESVKEEIKTEHEIKIKSPGSNYVQAKSELVDEKDLKLITIPQLDGTNDSDSDTAAPKPSKSKPNLRKLNMELKDPCSAKKHPKRLKSAPAYREIDSDEDFEPRSPLVGKNFQLTAPSKPAQPDVKKPQSHTKVKQSSLKKLSSTKRISHNKLTPQVSSSPDDRSKYFSSSPAKPFDIRNDIINLVKKGMAEQKEMNRSKLAKHKRQPRGYSDDDSDYAPEPSKKTCTEDFKESPIKVKRRIPTKKDLMEMEKKKKEQKEDEKKKKGVNIWIEVFSEAEEKWISIDVTKGQVHCVSELYTRATHPVSYILAWDNENYIKDVTNRYCVNWNTVTRKLRIDPIWWNATLKPFSGPKTPRDKEEDDELARQQLEKPLPTTISEYKNHPLYVLKRHLLKFEAIYPPDAATLGFVRGEPVYARDCVYVLHSREMWFKEAKVVKAGETPYKIVKARPKYDKLSNTMITDKPLEIFGIWQVDDYEPPTAENGKVPRNAYGNVELFKPCMIPKGTVHLQLPGLNKVAHKQNIDCAAAVVGFDFHSGWNHPTYDGYIVCEEFADQLVAAWYIEQEEAEKRAQDKMEKRVYGNWRRLIKGLLIRERLKAKYDFGEPSSNDGQGGRSKKKSKGPRFCTKKRRICSDSESDDQKY